MYLIDTDICVHYLRGDKDYVEILKNMRNLHISTATLAELFYGVFKSGNPKKHKIALTKFLFSIHVLDFDFAIAHKFGKIKSELKKKGLPVQDFDVVNASFSTTYDLTLLTNNIKHYKNIEGIKIESIYC